MFIKNKRARKKFSVIMEEIRTLGALCTMVLFFFQLHFIRVQLKELTEEQRHHESTEETSQNTDQMHNSGQVWIQ